MKFQVRPLQEPIPSHEDTAWKEFPWLSHPLMFDEIGIIEIQHDEAPNEMRIRASLNKSDISIPKPGFSLLDPLVQLIGIHFASRGIGGNLNVVGQIAVDFEICKSGELQAEYEVIIKKMTHSGNYSPPSWHLHADCWARWGDIIIRAKNLIIVVELDE